MHLEIRFAYCPWVLLNRVTHNMSINMLIFHYKLMKFTYCSNIWFCLLLFTSGSVDNMTTDNDYFTIHVN